MAYEPLAKLYYTDKDYEKIYAQRYNSENAIHIDFEVSTFPAFFVLDNSLFSKAVDIYKTDKRIKELRDSLPKKAIERSLDRLISFPTGGWKVFSYTFNSTSATKIKPSASHCRFRSRSLNTSTPVRVTTSSVATL